MISEPLCRGFKSSSSKSASRDFETEAANVTKRRAYLSLHPRQPEASNSRKSFGSRAIIITITKACLQTLSVQYNAVRFLGAFSRFQTKDCINLITSACTKQITQSMCI